MKHKTLTFRFLDMSRGGFARLFLLLLPCLSVIGVKAADNDGGGKIIQSRCPLFAVGD